MFRSLWNKVLFWKYAISAMVKIETGRWFVFRDTPTFVLEEIARLYKVSIRKNVELSRTMIEFYTGATSELEQRRINHVK